MNAEKRTTRTAQATTLHLRILFACLLFPLNEAAAQRKTVTPDLIESRLEPFGRSIKLSQDNQRGTIVMTDAQSGPAVVWIKDLTFTTGTLEFDVKGKDVMQQSFVGIAFHGTNDSTYQAIYFRPFNFQSQDAIRKSHSVQYIAAPKYDWQYLRETYPGKYENPLTSVVDPNSWFHVKVEVARDAITLFINTDKEPCLTVKPLENYTSGRIGFWVGSGSDGNFARLVVHGD